ncbi:MAG: SDR family oxidoreductase [Pirellulales bacterium]
MPAEKLPDKPPGLVLLTGATRGLGLAVAQRLLRDGYRVVGVARSCSPEYESLQKTSGIGQAHFVTYDFTDLDGIHGLVRSITAEHGPLYGLVNNAAIGGDGVLATMHSRDIEQTLKVNLHSPIHLTKYAARSMMQQRRGRIVNISSIVARTGYSGLSVYAASKAGLEGMTRSLARELGKVGITVNAVAPGFMETAMTAGLSGDKLASIQRRCALSLPQPSDVAGAVSYLMGPDGTLVTGTILTVDGGSTA